MVSLNSYERGKKAAEGRRVDKDINAGNTALFRLMKHWPRSYSPRLVFLLGNHEYRISRYLQDYPELEGTIGYHQFAFAQRGWQVVPFLQPIKIDGVLYCHYFCRNADGKVLQSKSGQASAKAQVQREHMSCTSGHKQGYDHHIHEVFGGRHHGIIAGSCYLHKENYLTAQGNDHWNGIVYKQGVKNGDYQELSFISLDQLKRDFG